MAVHWRVLLDSLKNLENNYISLKTGVGECERFHQMITNSNAIAVNKS